MVDAAVAYGDHIAETTGLPVIIKGSSLGAAAAYCAMAASDTFPGSVLMGFMIPSSPMMKSTNVFRTEAFEKLSAIMGDKFVLHIERFFNFDTDYGYVGAAEQKKADPDNTWFYDMASWGSLFRYDPVVPLAENTKPILFTVGEDDPTFPPEVARRVADATAGPVELYMKPQGKHQLMLFHTHEYTDVVTEWCRHLINGASS